MPIPILKRVPPSPEVIKHGLAVARNITDPAPPMVAESVPDPGPFDRPGSDISGVREMGIEERFQVAQSLAEAFEDDPHFSYMIRNDDKRLQRLGNGILGFIDHDWLKHGTVYTNSQLSGAAVSINPGEWKADMPTQLNILKSLIGATTPLEDARLAYVLGFVERIHKEVEETRGLHRYVPMIGVSPKWQGKRWGEALLEPMLKQCDAEKEAAYLEASTPRSVSLYERSGFRVIARGRYRGATEQLHFMWRDPQ